MAIGIRILSDNLSGQTTNVTYFPDTGGTIDLGSQVFPFNYISSYYYGNYDCYVPTYGYNYVVNVPGPTPTPTTTPTPTLTPTGLTPTSTSTPTVTTTNTQTQTSTPTVTPTNTETQTSTPTVTPTNTQTPTVTQTNTQTATNTPSITPTNTTTQTNTSTPTSTPTQTPTVTIGLTPTPTPTRARFNFVVYPGATYDESCGQYNSTTIVYGEKSIFDENTEFFNSVYGPVTIDMSGYYKNNGVVVELNSDGTLTNGIYGLCTTLTPTPTNTETPTPTPTNTETPTPTPTNTETPTPTPTNTETPTQTPTNTQTPTTSVTPTPTNIIRTALSGICHDENEPNGTCGCSQTATLYVNGANMADSTLAWADQFGVNTGDPQGYYEQNGIIYLVGSNCGIGCGSGSTISVYGACPTVTPTNTPTQTNTPTTTLTPTQTNTPTTTLTPTATIPFCRRFTFFGGTGPDDTLFVVTDCNGLTYSFSLSPNDTDTTCVSRYNIVSGNGSVTYINPC